MIKVFVKMLILFICGCLAITTFAVEESTKEKNLLKQNFEKLGSNGLPGNYKIYFNKNGKGKATVIQKDEKNILKLELPEQGNVNIITKYKINLEKNKKYVLTVQVKIDNQKYSGRGNHFFYVCAYNTNNGKRTYNKIVEHGSTNGWLTIILPIDTVKRPLLVGAKLIIQAYAVSGTYWLKNPMLIEIPNDLELKAHYILENSKTIPGGLLRLGTLSKLK